jgi:broad specificity phosphatase PhoE
LSYELGAVLAPFDLRQIVTSPEEKARATATVLAEVLGVSVVTDDRLREVRRPWTDGNFADLVAGYLRGDLIEGWEPVEHVVSRLEAFLLSRPSEVPIGVVTHGTAMTCLLGAGDSTNRARFWSDLTMPDAWTFSGEVPRRLDCQRP